MKKPKVSIIVPVYNVEQYIERCLDSLVNQTLKDIEIIVINDCSPDNSEEIIKKYLDQDTRIKYIKHQKNLGLGGARNTGIKAAKAKYIGSVDSDDWVDENMFEELYTAAIDGNYDVTICGFRRVNNYGKVLEKVLFNNKENINNGTAGKDIFSLSNPAFWNKLWKKSLYTKYNIEFPNHLYYEDLATTPQVYYYAKKIKYIKGAYYNYLWKRDSQKDSSITFTVSPKNLNDHFKIFEIMRNFLIKESIYGEYKDFFIDMTFASLIHHIKSLSYFFEAEDLAKYTEKVFYKFISFHRQSNIPENTWAKASRYPTKKKIRFLLIELTKALNIYNFIKKIKIFVKSKK
jgi:glycosyltransferase involved in cell wall biosynthesis